MKYMLLIYTDEAAHESNHPDMQALMGEYWGYQAELEQSGKFVAGDALQPTATATTIRLRDGQVQTSDGPFAETKEQLGGFYIVDAGDLDEAIQWASKIPDARVGAIEVRPIMEFEAPQG